MAAVVSGLKKIIKKISVPYKFYHFNPYYTYIFNKPNKYFFLHIIYLFLSNIINFNLIIKKQTKEVIFFKNYGFFKKSLSVNSFFFSVFSFMNNDFKNSERKIISSRYSNYTEDKRILNNNDSQAHIYIIPDDMLAKIENCIREDKELDNLIKFYFKSNYKIVNVRLWRYFANPENKLKNEVIAHYDFFPHKTLKIMIYKGKFVNKNSALEIIDDETNDIKFSIIGENPIVLIDTNHLYHQARFPEFDRDTIELTLQCSIKPSGILQAGCSAGHPINPFMVCKKIY